MANLEALIREEVEKTYLNFKAVQYDKYNYDSFLKDIIAMTNALTKHPRYIVIGVKAEIDGVKTFLGIQEQFEDEATYQQLVHQHIEPEIRLDYFPIEVNDVTLAVFHIAECDNPPYMMKKSYGNMNSGDSFIRKGTHQARLSRRDIDKFYELKTERAARIGNINIRCLVNEKPETKISPISELAFPSDLEEVKLKKAIEELAVININPSREKPDIFMDSPLGHFVNRIEFLQEDLENIKSNYQNDDYYYLCEERAYKINFQLINHDSAYLEDASIEIQVEKNESLIIPTRIPTKPSRDESLIQSLGSTDQINYPEVRVSESHYNIFSHIGDIKHQVPSLALKEDLRLVVLEGFSSPAINFKIKIHGKNLRQPVEHVITLKFTDPGSKSNLN